jgi:hypothetical protein
MLVRASLDTSGSFPPRHYELVTLASQWKLLLVSDLCCTWDEANGIIDFQHLNMPDLTVWRCVHRWSQFWLRLLRSARKCVWRERVYRGRMIRDSWSSVCSDLLEDFKTLKVDELITLDHNPPHGWFCSRCAMRETLR